MTRLQKIFAASLNVSSNWLNILAKILFISLTNVKISYEILDQFAEYCDELLIHGVDVEGKSSGVELELVKLLANWNKLPITYAGGIGSLDDLEEFCAVSDGKLDFTIGSALDLFGGTISYEIVKNL